MQCGHQQQQGGRSSETSARPLGRVASVRIASEDAAGQALGFVAECSALVLHVLQGAGADHQPLARMICSKQETNVKDTAPMASPWQLRRVACDGVD